MTKLSNKEKKIATEASKHGYTLGFKAARRLALKAFKDSRKKYSGMLFNDAWLRVEQDIGSVGNKK